LEESVRILYALDQYRPKIDGIVVSIERQAIGLADRGHTVAIVAPAIRFADYQERENDLTVYRLRSIRVFVDLWRWAFMPRQAMERILTEFQPHVIVVNIPLPVNSTAVKLARSHNIPVVGITGTMPEWLIYSSGILRPISKLLYSKIWQYLTDHYNNCDVVVGVTPTALSYLTSYGLCRPGRVISNGVQLESFRPRVRQQALADRLKIPDKPTVLYTGRLDAEKCMDHWVKAIPKVLRDVDAHFIIGGEGVQKHSLEDMVSKMGVQDHVTFTGFLSEEDYQHIHSLANVFAITSPAELQSIVTLEAASSGLPIVAVNAGALPELVKDGRNGFLISLGDSDELADRLIMLLKDDVLSRRMGRESRVIASQHDLNRTVWEYEHVYEDVVNDRSKEANSTFSRRRVSKKG
jgi:glycosyltransferase involved in cell wall biosynthesis